MTIAEAVKMVAAAGCTIKVGSLVLGQSPDREYVIYCHHSRGDGSGWWSHEEWFDEGQEEAAANRFVERAMAGSCLQNMCDVLPRKEKNRVIGQNVL